MRTRNSMRKIKPRNVDVVMAEKAGKFLERVVCDSVNDWLSFYFGKDAPPPSFFFEGELPVGTFSYAAGPDCECMAFGNLSEMVDKVIGHYGPEFDSALAGEFERLAKTLRKGTQ